MLVGHRLRRFRKFIPDQHLGVAKGDNGPTVAPMHMAMRKVVWLPALLVCVNAEAATRPSRIVVRSLSARYTVSTAADVARG